MCIYKKVLCSCAPVLAKKNNIYLIIYKLQGFAHGYSYAQLYRCRAQNTRNEVHSTNYRL
jgi:hypothetical protein